MAYKIITEQCNFCKKCLDECPTGCIKADDAKETCYVESADCIDCGACQDACESGALVVDE